MIEIESQVKKWGNSLGIVIPKETAERMKIEPKQRIRVMILKKRNVLAETFGTLKFKKSTARMMREIDRELWHEE